jgi:hypothetical protein
LLAGSVWHLRDKIARWLSAVNKKCVPSLGDLANDNIALRICGDLIDSKKHGAGCNKSGFAPTVGAVALKLSGTVGMKYDGAIAVDEILVTRPDPIEYTVEIVSHDGKTGDALELIRKAMSPWCEVLKKAEFLESRDSRTTKLKEMFDRFEQGVYPIVTSSLVQL